MKHFSVPADFKTETIDRYVQLNKAYREAKVIETYGNITVDNRFGSGRTVNLLPRVDFDQLARYAAYSRKNHIDFNYTLNPPYMQNYEFSSEGIREIKVFLGRLYEAGVRTLTVTLPSLIELIRSTPLKFLLKASTICQITNLDKAMAYKRLGVDRLVVDESINRDFSSLQKIGKAFDGKVEIIANVICYKNCIYRMFHYNQISGDSVEINSRTACDYYVHRCIFQRYESIPNLLKINWVRPEDLIYYSRIGIHYFKLQGRQSVLSGNPFKTLESYFKEDYDGDLMELLDMFNPMTKFRVPIDNKRLEGFLEPFVKNRNFCGHDCIHCGHCEDFAGKCIDIEKARQTINMAREFYQGYDEFNQVLRRDEEEPAKKIFRDEGIEVNFDFES